MLVAAREHPKDGRGKNTMKLIIAEKPSLARNIVAGIESFNDYKMRRGDGFFYGGEYLVTWAFGHLFSLADIDDYSPNPDGSTRWTMATLPCFPKEFRFNLRKDATKKVDSGVEKQFETIKTLCLREDVSDIIDRKSVV